MINPPDAGQGYSCYEIVKNLYYNALGRLSFIFSTSEKIRIVPKNWPLGMAAPWSKNGKYPASVASYNPLSLYKVMEVIVAKRLSNFSNLKIFLTILYVVSVGDAAPWTIYIIRFHNIV